MGKKFYKKIFLLFLSFFFVSINGSAEEIIKNEDDSNNFYHVYLDGNEVFEYDLIDEDVVNITQVYDGDRDDISFSVPKEFVIDYKYKLYGNYNYNFSLSSLGKVIDSRDILINYVGDNNSLININDIYYKDKVYYILGSNLKKNDVINMFNQEIEVFNASLALINNEGLELDDSAIIDEGVKLKLSASYDEYGVVNNIVDYFDIKMVGDINEDGNINNLDIKCLMIDDIFSNGNIFNIEDIKLFEVEEVVSASDLFTKNIEYNNNLYVDEIVEFKYYLNGFDKDVLSFVSGNINYDNEYLELISIDIDNVYGLYNGSGRFIYLLDNYNKDGLFITFKFKTLKSGSSNISLDNINFITGSGSDAVVKDILFNEELIVIEPGKGGDNLDDKEEIKDEKLEETEKKEEIILGSNNDLGEDVVVNNLVYEELLPSKSVKEIVLSSDNYLKSLIIDGYDIQFDKDILEYSINVSNDVNELDIDIILSDNDSFYEIIGNKDFKVGKNKVSIVVTSLDGNNRTYVINVDKDNVDENEKDNSENIIVMLMILIIIGLIYIIFKEDKDDIG